MSHLILTILNHSILREKLCNTDSDLMDCLIELTHNKNNTIRKFINEILFEIINNLSEVIIYFVFKISFR